MICPKCGTETNDNSQFCENCGTNLTSTNVQPIQQTTIENIQPTIETQIQNIQPENNQNKPKKGSTALIIIIVIMLMCIVGLLLFIFVINKDKNKDENEKEKEINNTTTTTTTTTTTKKDDDNNQNANLKLTDGYLEIKKQYETPITKTEIISANISAKINDKKEVEVDSVNNNHEIEILNLNGEKAKYLAGIKFFGQVYQIAILTEEKNIYVVDYANTKNCKKVETNYKFENFVVIDFRADYYNGFFAYFPGKGSAFEDALIGITSNNEYVFLSQKNIYLGKLDRYLLEVLNLPSTTKNQTIDSNTKVANPSILIFSNGELTYITEKSKFDTTEDNFKDYLNLENVKVNGKNIQVIAIAQDINNVYAITKDNKIYEIKEENGNVEVKEHTSKKIKNINKEDLNQQPYHIVSIKQIIYEDGTTEDFDITGYSLFE